MSILIKNGQVVLGNELVKADILIEGRKIRKIGNLSAEVAEETIDANGLTIMSGFVDMHSHLRDPGQSEKEDIASGTLAAVSGGYTSIACMPNTIPVIDNPALVKYVRYCAQEMDNCKVYPIGAATKGQQGKEISEMGRMKKAGIIAVSDDGHPIMDSSVMKNVLLYAKTHDILVISHSEDSTLSSGGLVNEGYNSTISGLKGIPRAAEEIGIARDVLLAEYTDSRVHIAHVSTRGSVEIVRQAKKRGVRVTAETCPHYFSATDDEIIGYNTNAKINPPLREENDLLAVIEGLKDGTIDAIATDHAPHTADEKGGEFEFAPFGTVGLETAFAIGYTFLVGSGELTLPQLSSLMSEKPAKILGLSGGVLKEGAIADLAIVDLEKSYRIDAKNFFSKGRNSVFDGWRVKGEVIITIVEGEIKFSRT